MFKFFKTLEQSDGSKLFFAKIQNFVSSVKKYIKLCEHAMFIMPRKKSNLSSITKNAKRSKLRRLRESSSERKVRLARSRECTRLALANETEEQRIERLARGRERVLKRRIRNLIAQKKKERLASQSITLLDRTNKSKSKRSKKNTSVESSAAAAIPYKPTLWYYKHLNFLSGKDKSDDEDNDNSDSDNEETTYLQPVRSEKVALPSAVTTEAEPEASVEASALAFGRSVGAQLHQMSKMQRCVAEKLISDVIYHAKMDQLTMAAYVCVNENPGLPTIEISPLIPKSGPSWYDSPIDTNDGEGSSSSTFITNPVNDLAQREMDETESAVNFIKLERDDSESYVFQDDLDQQRAVAVDVVIKEELP